MSRQRKLVKEAAQEPRGSFFGSTSRQMPQADYERALAAVEEIWQCIIQIHQYLGETGERQPFTCRAQSEPSVLLGFYVLQTSELSLFFL